MYFKFISANPRSLRFRLMLWNTAAGVLTGLGTLLAVREGVRYTLIYDLNQVLREDATEIQLYFDQTRDYDWMAFQEEMNRKASGHDYHGWFVRFFDRAGNSTWASASAPPMPRLTAEQIAAKTFRVDHYRLRYSPLPSDIEEAASMCVGCNERFIANDMLRIDRLVLLVGGIVVLIAPLSGYVLAGRTTRILANLIHKTGRLRPGELKERLPIRGTGDELDALARTVNGLLDRINDYLQQKHDFLANAAHELRTPLAAIRSSVEVALSGRRDEQEYRELLSIVINECVALGSLVNQLLLLAESDADRLITNAEPIALDQIVLQAVDMFQGAAEVQGVRLTVDCPQPVAIVGNRHHLRQVVNNLLDNALKFTAAQFAGEAVGENGQRRLSGLIQVRLSREDERGQTCLTISDNGIGIPPESLPKVFDRFYRIDKARTREGGPGGTGLGLSICQAIVEAHHGTIRVTSELGRGTTFTITMPIVPLAALPQTGGKA